ncbi:glutathione S-transferase family protein [Nitratireductor basaltis]|uniref:Glutathione S-transferase n=1 Tax=Nitratireductor basaltis TaxID=472175 RepID=A0A084U8T5_9HYPH|nr:glutathione S-transferase family protein [Nitratireductor basaltis]KFB09371.1 Glutathione S-transferase [Nitratireductor basaltis]
MTVTVCTYDWLPEFPRGFVRDMRVRWVLEEVGRPYRVDTFPLHPKSKRHRELQPFAQVPVIEDGGVTLFESGAILLHLGEGTALLPKEGRALVTQWLFAALNTIEIAVSHWANMVMAERVPEFFGPAPAGEVVAHARRNMESKLEALQAAIADRDWLVEEFSIADIAMVEVLRVVAAEDALDAFPALQAYVARATSRPAFRKALADHMEHWQAADVARATASPA